MGRLAGKVAVITGANSGIGLGLCLSRPVALVGFQVGVWIVEDAARAGLIHARRGRVDIAREARVEPFVGDAASEREAREPYIAGDGPGRVDGRVDRSPF